MVVMTTVRQESNRTNTRNTIVGGIPLADAQTIGTILGVNLYKSTVGKIVDKYSALRNRLLFTYKVNIDWAMFSKNSTIGVAKRP